MTSKYFKLSLRENDVYLKINNIKKYYVYTSHGIDIYDYHVVIDNIPVHDRNLSFDDNYAGLFIYVDEDKKIHIYDNMNKKYADIEDNHDVNHITYFYGSERLYISSLENVVKEIILSISLNNL